MPLRLPPSRAATYAAICGLASFYQSSEHSNLSLFFFLMIRRPRSSPLFPYTTLFRSGAVPVPDTPEVWGLLLALSVTANVALRDPVAVGVNVTLIVQVALAAKVEGLMGQLLV